MLAIFKDVLVAKYPKAPSFVSRMLMLVFAMAYGVYRCLFRLKQVRAQTKALVKIFEGSCDSYCIYPTEAPYLRDSQPRYFSRDQEVGGLKHC
ncbi:hypothetical protein Dimus_007856 [Dionaea muscipula]